MTKPIHVMPATTYALNLISLAPNSWLTTGERLTFLTMAAAADTALYTPDGYQGRTVKQIAAATAQSESTVTRHVTRLLEARVIEPGHGGYRIRQRAFDAANEVAS